MAIGDTRYTGASRLFTSLPFRPTGTIPIFEADEGLLAALLHTEGRPLAIRILEASDTAPLGGAHGEIRESDAIILRDTAGIHAATASALPSFGALCALQTFHTEAALPFDGTPGPVDTDRGTILVLLAAQRNRDAALPVATLPVATLTVVLATDTRISCIVAEGGLPSTIPIAGTDAADTNTERTLPAVGTMAAPQTLHTFAILQVTEFSGGHVLAVLVGLAFARLGFHPLDTDAFPAIFAFLADHTTTGVPHVVTVAGTTGGGNEHREQHQQQTDR